MIFSKSVYIYRYKARNIDHKKKHPNKLSVGLKFIATVFDRKYSITANTENSHFIDSLTASSNET
jgi:hypothetical protein